MSFDDDADDDQPPFSRPPHPDDRLWRHPSELGDHPISPIGPFPPNPSDTAATGGPGLLRRWGVTVAAVATAGVVVVGLGAVALGWDGRGDDLARDQPPATTLTTGGDLDSGGDVDLDAVHRAAGPSVVGVVAPATALGTPVATSADGSETVRTGSGVIVRPEGIVATTAALLGDGDLQVEVRLPDGTDVRAPVMGIDPVTGIGLLDLPGDGYTPAALGSPGGLTRGDVVFTVGASPSGTRAAARGTVGAHRRLVDGTDALEGMVALDGDSAPAALGGPVVDDDGTVLGVTALVEGSTAAYVAPIDIVDKVTHDVLTVGHVRHSWLGVNGVDATPGPNDAAFGLLGDGSRGARLEAVTAGGPAATAGLRAGDVVVAVDGHPISSMADLVRWLRACSPGQQLPLTVERPTGPETVHVTLGEVDGTGG